MGVGVVPEVVRRTHPWLMGSRVWFCAAVLALGCLPARVCVGGACCRVLGRCALVVACVACASLECGGVWVVVGGLVVICIVDASIIDCVHARHAW